MEKLPFRCEDCGFKFDKEPERVKGQCPYCGKCGVVKPEMTAQDLLDDV